MIAYLAKFLPNHSQTSALLRSLLRAGVAWVRTPAQDQAYRTLQQMLLTPPVLGFYSSEAPTIVSADVSSYAVGAVLLQVQEDGRRATFSYAFRSLTPIDRRKVLTK